MAPSIFLGMRLLLCSIFSLLAFLLYRSYWGIVVAVPSSLATIWLFGDPLTAFRLLGEMGAITWWNRKNRCDNAIRGGRIIRHVAFFAVFVGCPFLYFTEVYQLGTPHNVALTLVFKNFITSIFNVLVSYAVYSWDRLKRNRRWKVVVTEYPSKRLQVLFDADLHSSELCFDRRICGCLGSLTNVDSPENASLQRCLEFIDLSHSQIPVISIN